MADTSLRKKEPDRALVYMCPASAFDLLCGASLGHGHRQHLLPQPPLFSAEAFPRAHTSQPFTQEPAFAVFAAPTSVEPS